MLYPSKLTLSLLYMFNPSKRTNCHCQDFCICTFFKHQRYHHDCYNCYRNLNFQQHNNCQHCYMCKSFNKPLNHHHYYSCKTSSTNQQQDLHYCYHCYLRSTLHQQHHQFYHCYSCLNLSTATPSFFMNGQAFNDNIILPLLFILIHQHH